MHINKIHSAAVKALIIEEVKIQWATPILPFSFWKTNHNLERTVRHSTVVLVLLKLVSQKLATRKIHYTHFTVHETGNPTWLFSMNTITRQGFRQQISKHLDCGITEAILLQFMRPKPNTLSSLSRPNKFDSRWFSTASLCEHFPTFGLFKKP